MRSKDWKLEWERWQREDTERKAEWKELAREAARAGRELSASVQEAYRIALLPEEAELVDRLVERTTRKQHTRKAKRGVPDRTGLGTAKRLRRNL